MSIIHEALRKLEQQGSRPDPFLPVLKRSARKSWHPPGAGTHKVGAGRGRAGKPWTLALLILLSFIGGGVWATLRPEKSLSPGEAMTRTAQGEKVEQRVSTPGERREVAVSSTNEVEPGKKEEKPEVSKETGGQEKADLSPPPVKTPVSPKRAENPIPATGLTARQVPRSQPSLPPLSRSASDPGNAEEYFRRGVQLWKEKNIPEATKAFEKVLELNPKLTEAANNLGNLYYEQNLLEKAIAAFQRALAVDPNYARAHNNLGIVYTKKGLLDLAVGEYQAALGVNPDYAAPLYNLAWLYARQGETAKSLEYLGRAFQLDPGLKETASKDPEFSAVRGSENFRKLVGP